MPKENPILSPDVNDDHLNQIRALEAALNRLNILEHPREIVNICKNIIDLKKDIKSSDRVIVVGTGK